MIDVDSTKARWMRELWTQTDDLPFVGTLDLGVAETVMQSALATLPEFDGVWDDAQATPERGHRDLVVTMEACVNLGDLRLELGTTIVVVVVVSGPIWLENTTLPTSPSADTTASGPGVEIELALVFGQSLDTALDPDLALEGLPPETQAGMGVGGQVGGFARGAEIGIDDKPARVEFFQVHGARRHSSRGQFGRRQRHRLRHFRGQCWVGEPLVELGQG